MVRALNPSRPFGTQAFIRPGPNAEALGCFHCVPSGEGLRPWIRIGTTKPLEKRGPADRLLMRHYDEAPLPGYPNEVCSDFTVLRNI